MDFLHKMWLGAAVVSVMLSGCATGGGGTASGPAHPRHPAGRSAAVDIEGIGVQPRGTAVGRL